MPIGSSVIPSSMEVLGLAPDPGEEWRSLLRFVRLGAEDKSSMSESVSVLMQRAYELVVDTYEHLQHVPETAAILGWESGVDEAHLEERRRFFAIWLARTLGMDTSEEFAHYLFRAGKMHAGHGPRKVHTPPTYVTGSMGLVEAAFAAHMADADLPAKTIAGAMAGWSKYLSAQLHMMLMGYQVACDYARGDSGVDIRLFGRMRTLIGSRTLKAFLAEGETLHDILRRFFSYYPQVRSEALDRIWHSKESVDSNWPELFSAYVPKRGWRVLLNGRDAAHDGGFGAPVHAQDTIDIFPPGR